MDEQKFKKLANVKLIRASSLDEPDITGAQFDVHIVDSRETPVESRWIIQPSLPFAEAIESAQIHAKQLYERVNDAILHDNPPCLYPQYTAAMVLILPPDADKSQLITFHLKESI